MLVALGRAAAAGVALLAVTRAQQESSPSRLAPVPSTAASTAYQIVSDLLPAAAEWYPEAHRKSAAHYEVACHRKSDHLSSAADLVAGLAKILLAIAALLFIKLLTAKMFLLPAKLMFLAKIGLKSMLLYPIISKMLKMWKKSRKKKKGKKFLSKEALIPVRSPIFTGDCPAWTACLLRRAARGGWWTQLSALIGVTLDDSGGDSTYLLTLLEAVAPNEVTRCSTYDCDDGFAL